ncbi:MAG: ABC transporter ATP-binding protein [bacterium]|nr:ABC transporter ATP-binding protein [bacterium]
MLELLGLSRRYGRRWALREVSLSVDRGTSIALLGANGSGKTTLLKTVAGLLQPHAGEIHLDGRAIDAASRKKFGFLSHEPYLYAPLTLRENLNFFGKLFGLGRSEVAARIESLAASLRLTERMDDPIRVLSQGLRQRAALSRALLHDPEILLLDEPFSGLDPVAVGRFEEILGEVSDGRIVIMTLHDPARARKLAKEIAVLSGGRLVLRGEAARLGNAELDRAYRGELMAPAGEREAR